MKSAKVTPEKEIPQYPDNNNEVKQIPGKFGFGLFNAIEVLRKGHQYFHKRRESTQSSAFKINVGAKRYAICDVEGLKCLFDNEKIEKEAGFGRMKLDFDMTDNCTPSIFSNGVSHDHKKAFMIELCKIMKTSDIMSSVQNICKEYFQWWNGNVNKDMECDWEYSILSLVNDIVSEAFLGVRLDTNCSLYYVRGLFKRKYKKPGMDASAILRRTFLSCPKLEKIFSIAKEAGLSEREVIPDMLFMLTFNAIGGIDTTIISALGRFTLLEQQFKDEMVNQIREVVKEKGITDESLKEMTHLKSYLLEVLRMHPSVEMVFGKAKCDFVMSTSTGLYQIYQGDLLMGHFKLAQVDPKKFEEPTTFKPRRFQENSALAEHLILFHGTFNEEAGPKNHKCPGQGIAVNVMMGILAHIFFYTEFELTGVPCWTGKNIRRFGCPDKPLGLRTFTYKGDEATEETGEQLKK